MNLPSVPLNYEAHVTIEPVFDDRLEKFTELCKKYDFRVAELLMKKREKDTLERSPYDTFCTGRSKDWDRLYNRTTALVAECIHYGFKVWRYKIESTLIDVRLPDEGVSA